ncbi:MAG: glycosyltransferase, partial [Pseudomonadales bacterium]|nr:glycosyltransferase [Pseudomonadales bacterium]
MKKVLLIAYHFPPILISSGLQRTLSLARYSNDYGWEPMVLSIAPRGYPLISDNQLKDIPPGVLVERAFGLDTARHLSFSGRYPGFLALPDRWATWLPMAVISGLKMIRKYRPNVLWSTYPIATAQLIGLTLHRLTGISWVADFRDSMTEEQYPHEKRKRQVYRWIEKRTVEQADKVVFTAPGTLAMYQDRYPRFDPEKFKIISNGFDEEIFQAVEKRAAGSEPKPKPKPNVKSGPLILLHSGILYSWERNPSHFFQAIAELKSSGEISALTLNIILRASGYEKSFRPVLKALDIEDIVFLKPGICYEDALTEMLRADGLLV